MMIGGYSNPVRLNGLNSGLDTEGIVEAMLTADKSKIDSATANKQIEEWKLEMYNEINTKLTEFSNKFFSVLSPDNVISANSFITQQANFPENSYFKVSATGGVIPGNYKISSVSLAKNAQLSGTSVSRYTEASGKNLANLKKTDVETEEMKKADGSTADGSTQLGDIVNSDGKSAFGFTEDKDVITFSVNNKSFTFNKTDSLDDVAAKINEETGETKVTASIEGGKLKLESDSAVSLKQSVGTVFGEKGGFAGLNSGTQPMESTFTKNQSIAEFEASTGVKLAGDDGNVSFSINGESFSFGSDASLADIESAVNASGAGVKMTINEETGEFTVRSTTSGKALDIQNTSGSLFGKDSVSGIDTGSISKSSTIGKKDSLEEVARKMNIDLQTDDEGNFGFKLNGVEFKFDKDTTVEEMVSKVNGSTAGVTMAYSEITDSFVFSSAEMGADSKIEFENLDGSNAFGDGGIFGIASGTNVVNGKDASITINGEVVTQSSNTFTIDGMTFELTGEFEAADSTEEVNVSFTQKTEDAVAKMETFVKEYNELVNYLENIVNEKKQYDYKPLTEDQKKEMSEKEIEDWEKQAKKGLLKNDSAITGLLSDLRGAIYSVVGDSGASAGDFGISTSSKDGTIKLDKEKLQAALESDPQGLTNIFTNTSLSTDKTDKYNESGYFTRLSDAMFNHRTNTRNVQISSVNSKITGYKETIDKLTATYKKNESRYWAQFTRLETAMSSLNSQQSWITSMMGSM